MRSVGNSFHLRLNSWKFSSVILLVNDASDSSLAHVLQAQIQVLRLSFYSLLQSRLLRNALTVL